MKINGTIFSKPQQDQLKRAIENSDNGGTTLNRYETTLGELVGNVQGAKLLHKIITTAKGNYTVYSDSLYIIYSIIDREDSIFLEGYKQYSDTISFQMATLWLNDAHVNNNFKVDVSTNGVTTGYVNSLPSIHVIYFNDTEII